MQFFDTTDFSSIRDDGEEDIYQREIRRELRDGTYVVTISVPGDLVPPVVIETENPDITFHALRQYIAVKNQEALLRRMPLARRRQDERRQRLMNAPPLNPCPGCGGRGWVEDFDKNERPCPTCRPNA